MKSKNKMINYKLCLLKLAIELANVSLACKILGYNRTTFYRYKKAYLEGGEDALLDVSRKKPNLKNQVLPYISEAVLSLSLEHPEFGKQALTVKLPLPNSMSVKMQLLQLICCVIKLFHFLIKMACECSEY